MIHESFEEIKISDGKKFYNTEHSMNLFTQFLRDFSDILNGFHVLVKVAIYSDNSDNSDWPTA